MIVGFDPDYPVKPPLDFLVYGDVLESRSLRANMPARQGKTGNIAVTHSA
jgi:hypothetical protein